MPMVPPSSMVSSMTTHSENGVVVISGVQAQCSLRMRQPQRLRPQVSVCAGSMRFQMLYGDGPIIQARRSLRMALA